MVDETELTCGFARSDVIAEVGWCGSCVLERPACSLSAGGLAASGAVPGAAEQVTS